MITKNNFISSFFKVKKITNFKGRIKKDTKRQPVTLGKICV